MQVLNKRGEGTNIDGREILKYKYVINTHGNGNEWNNRLRSLLSSGAVVFKQEATLFEFFERELVPYEHYIPVRSDLSDLVRFFLLQSRQQQRLESTVLTCHLPERLRKLSGQLQTMTKRSKSHKTRYKLPSIPFISFTQGQAPQDRDLLLDCIRYILTGKWNILKAGPIAGIPSSFRLISHQQFETLQLRHLETDMENYLNFAVNLTLLGAGEVC